MGTEEERKRILDSCSPYREHDACGIGAVVNLSGAKTRQAVDRALKIVEKLEHRAGKDAAGETGDGVGIMIQVPHQLMKRAALVEEIELGGERDYGVGMFFFPQDSAAPGPGQKDDGDHRGQGGHGASGLAGRAHPPGGTGREGPRKCMPVICQCFRPRPEDCPKGLAFDRKLYVARRVFEQSNINTYIPSFSSRTIVYKGMLLVGQLRRFYDDLQDPDCVSAIALVHSRFSTNTNPSWERAHPYRYIMHNGEINTIRGNMDRMLAREETMRSP
jgi:glutamate synthase (NADPH/NADH) large chain